MPSKHCGATQPKNQRPYLAIIGLLACVLSLLFWRSFLPDYVHFSNDGPLGQQHTAWSHLPGAFAGIWDDLNSIGINDGASSVDITTLTFWLLGAVGLAKFFAPLALFILGLGAWTFFRALKLSPLAATLGALAATLNSDFFSDACWGVATHQIAFGMDFFALALIVSNSPETPTLIRWTRLALAGLAVGINVMEGADVGAIFSVFVAAFVFYKVLTEENVPVPIKLSRGIARVAIVAVFAGFIAFQTVLVLVSTNIQGIAGTQQDAATKAARWGYATQWSFPKVETLGIVVPGLFGYRMDTPIDMMPALQGAYQDGMYWGAIGRGAGTMRFCGGGYYAGVIVIFVALWAVAQSLRRKNNIFSEPHRRSLWFWTAILIGSLLLSWGKFAPFYAILYKLPYFSTIRDPTKFLYVFSWALVIIFAYGVHGLSRCYLEIAAAGSNSLFVQLKTWWAKIRGFDRDWTCACIITIGAALVAWLIYGSDKLELVNYLETVGFPDEGPTAGVAKAIAAFSIESVGWFILFFALAIGLVTFVLAGFFSGRRAKWAGIFLGALLIVDLGRADLPWIIHWNYVQKYDIDPSNPDKSTNPILNFLRDKSYEHRVARLPWRFPQQFALFENLYGIEWAQHQFPYYDIQSLNIIQMPRTPVDLDAYETALAFQNSPETAYLLTRKWQLTNTRYLLGPAGFLDALNEQFDPAQHRFRIVQRFNIVPKPGVDLEELQTELEHGEFHGSKFTANLAGNGDYAVFEFTGALPRAKLYANWQTNSAADLENFTTNGLTARDLHILNEVGTNDFLTLKKLTAPSFNPEQTVLLDEPLPASSSPNPTNENPGTVEFKGYAPKDIVLDAKADAPSVLLLNDKYNSDWRVTVDGKPAQLLRCNFIMRGVYLTPGAHTVEFQFKFPNGPLYVTCAAWAIGILLLGFLIFSRRKSDAAVRI